MELKDSQGHTKALNKFYSNVTEALEGMADAGKETAAFQNQLNQLTSNIANLNKVYGGMLTAMKS
jgi:gliding motility-associated protein GldL